MLEKYIPPTVAEVKLTLPKLKMSGPSTPTVSEIKLPKLKKIE